MPPWVPYAVTWIVSTILGGAAVYAAMRSAMASLEARVTRLEADIGTHETGLRGASHAQAQHISVLYGRVGILDHQVKMLEKGPHA